MSESVVGFDSYVFDCFVSCAGCHVPGIKQRVLLQDDFSLA